MDRIRILYVLSDLNKCNGISTYVMNYYRLMNHEKFKCDFLLTSNNICDEYDNLIKENLDNIFIINGSLAKEIRLINDFFKNNYYDIVYSHILYKCFLYFKAAKKNGIKHRILHSHNVPTRNKNFLKEIIYKFLSSLAVRYSTDYFSCADHAGKYLFKNKEFHVIKNAIDLNAYKYNESIRIKTRESLNIGLDEKILINVGRIREQKNQKFLVDVLEKLVNVNDKYRLLLVGDGPMEKELKQYVKEKNMNKKITFMGLRNDVYNILQASDIFLLPSLFEGLAFVTIEAQAAGLPCILSSKVSSECKVSENIKFLGIETTDIDLWCETILEYSKLDRCNNEKKIIENGFDINNEVKKLENLFIKICGGQNL